MSVVRVEQLMDVYEEDVDHDLLERTMRMVETLPDRQQTMIRLRHMEGMEMSEIAQLTGSTEVAVRKALSRARKTLAEKFRR
jgi:RNA polymerase sigma-70 factor (ECF subfamily)